MRREVEGSQGREPLLQDGGEKFGPSSSLPLPNDLTGLKSITGGEVAEKLVSWRPLMGYTILFVVAFLAIAAMSVAILEYVPADHHKPECRKSSALAVLPGAGAGIATMELLVWSGMARNRTPLADLHTYGVAARRWRTVGTSDAGVPFWRQLAPKAPAPAPLPRWKAGTGQVVGSMTGMLVFGGDAFLPTGSHIYERDIWLLDYPTLKWQKGHAAGTAGNPANVPSGRRAHSAVLYHDRAGVESMVVFGGRRKHDVLLGDAWEARLSWPNVTWRLVAPGRGPAGEGPEYGPASAPPPRKGHSAVMVSASGEPPQMLIFGGRDEAQYFDDLWLLDVETGSWRQLQPSSGVAPRGRDHHSASFFRGRMLIYGGRSGATYLTSRPLGDLWAFDLETLAWQQVPQAGPTPLPRYLHAFVQYTPPGSADSRLVVFGGESLEKCQLNDAWELSLTSMLWSQLSPPKFCRKRCKRAFEGFGTPAGQLPL